MQQTAATMLEELGVSVTVADARFCKPLDTELVRQLADNHTALVTVEEGSIGGFASHVTQYMLSSGLLDGSLKLRCMHLPDVNIEHGSHDWQLEQAGLSPKDIAATVLQLLDRYGHRESRDAARSAKECTASDTQPVDEPRRIQPPESESELNQTPRTCFAGSGKRSRCLRRSKLRHWRRRPWRRHCGRRGGRQDVRGGQETTGAAVLAPQPGLIGVRPEEGVRVTRRV